MPLPDHRFARRLAISNMTEVLLAKRNRKGTKDLVVIKRILPHLFEDLGFVHVFMSQAHIAAQLHHPNVARTEDAFMNTNQACLVMEYLLGEHLGSIRCHTAPLPISLALKIIEGAASGLCYAHGRGVLHKDLRPSNVMVTYTGITKLMDFGLSEANVGNVYTRPQSLMERYAYSAPEQLGPMRDADRRADIFALGVHLYELLTGRQLFVARSAPEVIRAVKTKAIPPIEGPAALRQFVQKALARDPTKRFQNARDFLEALRAQLLLHPAEREDLALFLTERFASTLDKRRALQTLVLSETAHVDATEDLPGAFGDASLSPLARTGPLPVPPGLPGLTEKSSGSVVERLLKYFR